MTSTLSDYLARRAEIAQRAREAAQKAASHDDDAGMVVGREIAILRAPIDLTIDYSDANERVTTRPIQVRKFDGRYIGAYCLMRRANRTFLADRVLEAFDNDGVVIDDFQAFLSIYFGPDSLIEEARIRQRYWRSVENTAAPELLLLRVLAAADGVLSPQEATIIGDHALALMARRDVPGERDQLLRYVSRLSGTRETITSSIDFLARQSRARRRRFGDVCLALIEADGHVDDAEIDVLRIIESAGGFG